MRPTYDFHRRRKWFCVFALFIGLAASGPAHATAPEDRIGGTMRAESDGKRFEFPSLKSDISADIEGDLATVTVVQTFLNPTKQPMNATYLFPLNKDAAVYAMQMEVGDELITAVIKKKQEARATFENAKQQGKAAALLDQHRPNMFTQELANLMPGQPVKVTLKYTQTVPRVDGAYELVVPLVVGPRYTPKREIAPQTVSVNDPGAPPTELQKSGEWRFGPPPAYPNVSGLDIPDTIEKDRVSIAIDLQAGFPIKAVSSRTHAVLVTGEEATRHVSLADGRTIDNRDFVLRYQLAGRTTQAGILIHKDQRGDVVSLLLEPPVSPKDEDVTPREMVFVLDTSGSMSGQPIEASKVFMLQALKSLRSTDYFRIIRFSSSASEFNSGPVPATTLNRLAGAKFVSSLRAGGGTEVKSGITRAFAVPQQPGTMRIVTFLSDGYIGNEAEILQLIGTHQNDARIYAFGVGTSVNRYLLAEMARMGRGLVRFIDPTEDDNLAAIDLAKRLEAPVLTDISVDWGELAVDGATPDVIPDLFKGDSLRIMGRFKSPLQPGSTHTVHIKGLVNGRTADLPLSFRVPDSGEGEGREALSLIWARMQIADRMRHLTTPQLTRRPPMSDGQLEHEVTQLGLDYSLMTQWTSFVAVSQKIINERPGDAVDKDVPLNQIKGVSKFAYGENIKRQEALSGHTQKARIHIQPTRQPNLPVKVAMNNGTNFRFFSGGSTPEPGVYGGLIVITLMSLFGLLRRRRTGA